MRFSKTTVAAVPGVVLLSAVAAPTAKAGIITFTFTVTDASGTIGSTSFNDAAVTVTALGDTSAVFEAPAPPWDPNTFYIVPTQFDVST
jgi:hypothetical protein